MAMAPSLCRRRKLGFPPFRSFFFRALALWQRLSYDDGIFPGRLSLQPSSTPWSLRVPEGSGPAKAVAGRSSAGAPDLLSDLPDCLLHTIMSFMKARQVVQTCVLSKRWRHLWCSVPCLNVDVDEFKTKTAAPGCSCDKAMNWDVDEFKTMTEAPGCSCDKAMNWKEWGKFVDFAVNLVQRCNIALLDSLRLHGHGDRTPLLFLWYAARSSSQMERLMSSAASWRRLRRLQLTCVPLDHCFATIVGLGCHHLEDLELDGCTFEIHRIFFDSLKNLFLKHCRLGNLSEIAASPTLKTLAIYGGLNDPLVIFAPAVAYLHLAVEVDGFAAGVSIKEMPSLDKAMIQLFCHRYYVPNTELSGDRFKFLHSVSNATSLELCSVGGMVLGKDPTPKEFQNLKNLLLDHCDLSDDCILEFFLRDSPNLEKLTLRHCKLSDDTEVKPVLRLKTTDFLRENLKFEIVYKERYTRQLFEFMMLVSGYRLENYIKLLIGELH